MPPTDIAFFVAASTAAFLVGMSKGGLPAIGALGVPVLALAISPVRAAGLLLPIFVITDMVGLWVYRREFNARIIAIIVPSAAAGVLFGWATASWMSEALVTLLVGCIGIVFCLLRVLPKPAETGERRADLAPGLFWGAVTGFVSFVSHSGAPPYQMYVLPLRLKKLVFAGTSTISFAMINAIKLIPYWVLGQLSPANLRDAAILVPVAVLGTVAGARLTRVLPDVLFFRLVTLALFVISLKLVWDGVVGLVG
jgi:uncharacterized membrane protein YfcA